MKTKTKSKRKEPKPRRTSLCAVCKKPRPPLAIRDGDPFCSSSCCRLYHRVDQ